MNLEVSTDKSHQQDGPLVIQDGELVFTGAQPWERFTRDLPRLRKIDDLDYDTVEYLDADGNVIARAAFDSDTIEYVDADGNVVARAAVGYGALKDLDYETAKYVDADSNVVEYVDTDGNTIKYEDTDGNTIARVDIDSDTVEYLDADGNVVARAAIDSDTIECVDANGNVFAYMGSDIVKYVDSAGHETDTYLNVDGVLYVEAEDSSPAAEAVAAADDDEYDYDLRGVESWLNAHRETLDDGRCFMPFGLETPDDFWTVLGFWGFGSRYPYKGSDCIFDDREGARKALQKFLEANRAWIDLDDCDLEKTLDLAFMKEADGRYYLRAPSWSDLDLQDHPATRGIYRGRR